MKRFIGLILLVGMLLPLGAQLTFAREALSQNSNGFRRLLVVENDPCTDTDKDKTVPDCINVRKIFSTPGQKSFIPEAKQPTVDVNGNPNPEEVGDSVNPTGIVGFVIFRVIDILIKLVGSIAMIIFIIGGVLLITSEGKDDRLEKGKNAMTYAVIGVAITFFSFLIVSYVQSLLF